MSEDVTKKLSVDEKLDLLLHEMSDVKTRLTKLESFAEDRARDTRPMLDKIHKEIADTRADVAELKAEMVQLKADVAELKADMADVKIQLEQVKERLDKIEYRLRMVERGMGVLAKDVLDMKALQQELEDRVFKLEALAA